jgi:hypothetical protein
MATQIYLKETHLDDLKSHIGSNLHYYESAEPWLDSFFKEGAWHLPSNISLDCIELVMPKSSTEHYDFENTKIIYDALKGLTLAQATDERLWASLTHFTFWKYMRARWAIEETTSKKLNDYIKERYFVLPHHARGLIRNGIARLWWYGYVSYDEKRSDPYELTRIMLKKLDIPESLLGRAFSYNRNITMNILEIIAELDSIGKPFYKRDPFRDLMKYINQLGGVTVLDALDKSDLEGIMHPKIEKLSSLAT